MTPDNDRDTPVEPPAAGDRTADPSTMDAGAAPGPGAPDAGPPPGASVVDDAAMFGAEGGEPPGPGPDAGAGGEAGAAAAPDGSSATEVDGEAGEGGEAEPTVEDRLEASEALAAMRLDQNQRLQAEMENQRKRAQRDVSNARKFALDGIAGDLLPVKDSLELGIRAAAAEEGSLANLLEGSELTLKMLAQVLEKNAIVEIDPEGEKFDPEFHQAMSMQEVEGVAPNTVTGVMQKGYTLNDRLLRPALVMVSK